MNSKCSAPGGQVDLMALVLLFPQKHPRIKQKGKKKLSENISTHKPLHANSELRLFTVI